MKERGIGGRGAVWGWGAGSYMSVEDSKKAGVVVSDIIVWLAALECRGDIANSVQVSMVSVVTVVLALVIGVNEVSGAWVEGEGRLEGDEVLPSAAGSKGDEGDEVKGDEIDEGCKGVVGLVEFSGVAGLRKIRGEREKCGRRI
jgi:hypothetical protein